MANLFSGVVVAPTDRRLYPIERWGRLPKLHRIGMGARFKGQAVVLMIAVAEVRILTPDGEPLRILILDRARDYHPQSLGWTPTMS